MDQEPITIDVEGRSITAPPDRSIIEAVWEAGYAHVQGVGCLGGVCGSCRAIIRRADSTEVKMVLACETLIEAGMQVTFVPFLERLSDHPYQLDNFKDTWRLVSQVNQTFPEAAHCRHCGGCNSTCPKGIEVERGVNLAVEGQLGPAGDLFETCIMCNLCSHICPEFIDPNHLGLLVRRVVPALVVRPFNLMQRLTQLERGELYFDYEAPDASTKERDPND
ncbi:MAG: (2Fe-2S)-binding protein [Anaerolineae bacterium]|nr:(2Fe-2S)-binding protein [Anaerolineae bacterium]